MWRVSGVIAGKELREAVRDRRALFSALFYAAWGPAIMAMAVIALARERGPEPLLVLPIAHAERAPALSSFLRERQVTVVAAPADPGMAVRSRHLPVVLVVGPRYGNELTAFRPAPLTLIYDAASAPSASAAARVRTLVNEYARRLADTRLILRGVAPAAVTPISLGEQDVSTSARRAASVLGTLPIFLLVAAFVGGMGLAADQMAGERERRSLESLLAYPVPRAAIVAGKWAASSVLSVVTVTLTLAAAALVLQHPRIQAMDLPMGLGIGDAVRLWLLLAPLAVMVTAAQLLLALFARTYKEAQIQLSLLMFLPMIPGFLFAFGSLPVAAWMTRTPVLAQQVLVSDVLRGQPPTSGVMWAVALIALATGAAAAAVTAALLARETIVRRAA